jgi:hypothetical protein
VHATTRADGNPDDDRDTLRVSIGRSPLTLVEIHPRPQDGAEWIEVEVQKETRTHGWTLKDAGGTTLVFADTLLSAGARVLLSQVRAAGTFPWTGSWPALNDRAGEDGIADSLVLRDAELVIRDWVAYGEGPKGRSWIRLDPGTFGGSAWKVDETDGGTPGAGPGSPGAPAESGDRAVPRGVSLERTQDGVWIRVAAPVAPLDYQVRILDLAGRAVWADRGRVPYLGDARCRWDGTDRNGRRVAQGLYLVETARSWAGGQDRAQLTFVVGR